MNVTCPTCNADQDVSECALGVLGTLLHLRCRYCGAGWDCEAASVLDDIQADLDEEEDDL